MDYKKNFKITMSVGIIIILIGIIIGILFEHDIAFVFGGIGTILIGLSILSYINKNDVE